MTDIRYSYMIEPRPDEVGGGWSLRLFDGEEEVGGGVFPLPAVTADDVRAWWTELGEVGRAYWHGMAHSPDPFKVHRTYLLAETHADAEAAGNSWAEGREDQGINTPSS